MYMLVPSTALITVGFAVEAFTITFFPMWMELLSPSINMRKPFRLHPSSITKRLCLPLNEKWQCLSLEECFMHNEFPPHYIS